MTLILPVKNIYPEIGSNCFLAENCTIVGDVVIGDNCSVWFNAVIRGDVNWRKQINTDFNEFYNYNDRCVLND